ncbi:hypothetical protein (partial), partial (plasmid) [Erwinia amylovora ATCC 49946]
QQVTSRIDADVLAFFSATGRYQTRIHAVLRSCVEAHKDECQMLH